jgi:Pleckstrin homology domain
MGGHLLMTIYRIFLSVCTNRRCAFVVWHGQRKLTFRSQKERAADGGEKHSIASVGLPGDIVVFMARSRVERDLWVTALGQEINHHASTIGEQLNIY